MSMRPSSSPGRVYVDFDDVLCETARDLARLLEERSGKVVAYEDIRTFDLGVSFSLGAKDLDRFMEAAHAPEVIGRIPLVKGAREVMADWMARGLEVCVVTGRPLSTLDSSKRWLERHGVGYSRLIFVDKYQRAGPDSGATTLEELSRTDFLFAIDDAPAMLECLASRMSMPIVVFDRPWNQGSPKTTDQARKVLRCGSWEEIRRATAALIPDA